MITFRKNRASLRMLIGSFLLLACSYVSSQSILKNEILDNVLSSVFEVVVEKPAEGSITYEKSLPFSRLAFSIRNDTYLPQGTAFLMSDGLFYSAAHVFTLSDKTIYTDYYIRDRNGKTYMVDTIIKFSTNRDFIAFTVKDYPKEKQSGLEFTSDIVLNSQIFSVGNALGDGIVIRDGILTSQTYESQNGEWKWLRFSAAASPGNSGGPLITSDGKVLGLITMKSENENLNYALPFSEISLIPEGTGYMFQDFYYTLPNILSEKFYHKFTSELKLPLELKEVQNQLTEQYTDYCTQVVDGLRKQFSPGEKKSFSHLTGWEEVLNSYYLTTFPYLLYLSDTNTWNYAKPSKISNYQLEDNGVVSFGSMMNYTMAVIKKPDSLPLQDLISNPDLYTQYILRASRVNRSVAGENIAITSLGTPVKSEKYVDYFDRTWQVNYWNLAFADYMVITYALPLPEGLFVLFRYNSTGLILGGISLDTAFLTDFVYPSYIGTLKNWKEFLSLSEETAGSKPDFIKNFKVEWDASSTILSTGKMGFTIPSSYFLSDGETMFRATCSYKKTDTGVELENRSFDLYTSPRVENYKYIYLSKNPKPPATSVKKTLEQWNQKLNCVSPFNAQPYNYEEYTYYDKILYPEGITFETRSSTDTVYVLSFELDGQNRTEDMLDFAGKMEKTVQISQ